MKKMLMAATLLLVLQACKNSEPDMLVVEGQFTHAAGKKLMLAMLPFTNPQREVADSVTLDSTGKFKLETLQQQEGMYQLFIQGGAGILFINDTNHIIINANADSLGSYQVQNSQATQSLKSLYTKLDELNEKDAAVAKFTDSIARIPTAKMSDSLKAPYLAAREKSTKSVADFLTAYLSMEKNATAQWYGLGIASRYLTKEQWGAQLKRIVAVHPHHPGLALMKVSYAAAEQQEAMGKHLLNKPLPDMNMADTSGKMVALKSFRGKWLLVDFWASWCPPCRADNPNLVAAYKQFKNKGFNIVGVSLDDNKEAWTKAIQKDSLTWTQLSDLKQWESDAVKLYGFNAIPFNVLVDTSGKAVATNLHGPKLTKKLKEVLK